MQFNQFYCILLYFIAKLFMWWVKALEEQAQSGCQADVFFPRVKGADRQKNYVMKNL